MSKKLILGAVLVILSFTFFLYFWGSSSHFPAAEYNSIQNFEHSQLGNSSDTFCIMTFNLGYLSGMTNNLAVDRSEQLYNGNLAITNKMINDIRPDFLAFQEIDFDANRSFNHNQYEEIAVTNGYSYGAMAVNWDKRYVPFPFWPPSKHFGKMLSGQALLCQFKITANERIVLEKPDDYPFYYKAYYIDRVAQISTIDVGGKLIKIINVHLEAFEVLTREIQAAVVLSLYRDLAVEFPVFLVGDFNSLPPFATASEPEDKSLNAFFKEPGLGVAISEESYLQSESDYYTFDSETPYQKLDYIFYSKKDIVPVSARVVHEAGQASDHLPVLFQFRWR